MKKIATVLTLFFLIFCSNNIFAQTKTNLIKTDGLQNVSPKQDSAQLKQAEVNAFIEQVVKNTPITEFQQWCYKKNDG